MTETHPLLRIAKRDVRLRRHFSLTVLVDLCECLNEHTPSLGKVNLLSDSLHLDEITVRRALRLLVVRRYLGFHGRTGRGVGLYTLATVVNGAIASPLRASDEVPNRTRAA